jgi:N-acetylglucosamine-6-phosphate deacetylase
MQFLARRYDNQQTVRVNLTADTIHCIEPIDQYPDSGTLPWLCPGFVDLQVNGYGGIAFNAGSLNVDDVSQVSCELTSLGVTRYCPTVTTDSEAVLRRAMQTIAAAVAGDDQVHSRVLGIHLEGPYISAADGPRGAHPKPHVRPPDWDEFQRLQDAANGLIRILTLSPACPEAPDFISRVSTSGVLVAIGHTDASSEQITAAVDAGARLSTHLGNGAHGQIRRHPNYIWDQLAEDRLTASLIVDGHHLPAAVVKSFLRAKTTDRCILVSDITALAGRAPGQYQDTSLGAVEVLEDGRLVIAGQRQLLAGAALPITAGIANVVRFTGHSLRTAIDMASVRPAAVVGAPVGRIEPGARADLVLFRFATDDADSTCSDFQLTACINAGELVWGKVA